MNKIVIYFVVEFCSATRITDVRHDITTLHRKQTHAVR